MRPDRPLRSSFLVFGQPEVHEDDIAEVVDSLRARWLGTGPKVARFKAAFAAYKGVEHVTAVNSCTAGLHLACIAADLGPGDEVITTPLTFCATANSILHSGATPVLADVEPGTMNLSASAVEAAITPRTRAIMPVHFAGRMCDMDSLMAIADRHGLAVIEDCAHAIESGIGERGAGTFGDFGVFSFYATKNVSTGEGGMVVAKRAEDAERLERLSLHGMSADAWKRFGDEGFKRYDVVERGFKFNMMDLQAALGIHQLGRIERNAERRREIWASYQEQLRDLPLELPMEPAPGTRHAYHLYTPLVRADAAMDRDALLDAMTARRIGVGVHYRALPDHPYYQSALGWCPEQVPVAADIGRRTVSLPLSPTLTDDDVLDVVDALTRSL